MSKEKLDQVGVNISEKAKLIWNVADLIVGPFIENIPLKEDIQEYFKREVLMRLMPGLMRAQQSLVTRFQ